MTERAAGLFMHQTAATDNTPTPNHKKKKKGDTSPTKMIRERHKHQSGSRFCVYNKKGRIRLKGRKSTQSHSHAVDPHEARLNT